MPRITKDQVEDFVRQHVAPVAISTAREVVGGKHPVSAGIQAATDHAVEAAHGTVHDAIHQGSSHRGRQLLAKLAAAGAAVVVAEGGRLLHDATMDRLSRRTASRSSH